MGDHFSVNESVTNSSDKEASKTYSDESADIRKLFLE